MDESWLEESNETGQGRMLTAMRRLLSPLRGDDSSPLPVSFVAYEVASKVLVLSFSLFLPLLIDRQGDAVYGDGAGKVIWAYAQVAISIATIGAYLCLLGLLDFGRMKRKTLYTASMACAVIMILSVFCFDASAVIFTTLLVVAGKTTQRISDVAFESLIDAAVKDEHEAHALTSRAQAMGFLGIIVYLLVSLGPLLVALFLIGTEVSDVWKMYILPNVSVGVWSLYFVYLMQQLMPVDLGKGPILELEQQPLGGRCRFSPALAKLYFALKRGLSEQWSNVQYTRALPDLRALFFSYIFLNGAANTASSVAAILAISVLEAPLWVLGVGGFLGLVTALGGLALFRYLTLNDILTVKHVLCINIGVLALAAVYSLAVKTDTDLIILMSICGSQLGSFSSFTRSLVSTLVPSSHQSRLFSLFELVKDGTAWIGSFAIAQLVIIQGEDHYRTIIAVVCVSLMAIGLPIFIFKVDIARGRADRLVLDSRERGEVSAVLHTGEGGSNDEGHVDDAGRIGIEMVWD